MQETSQDNLLITFSWVLSATKYIFSGTPMTTTAQIDSVWSDFLISENAQFDDNGKITTFGNTELERFSIKNGPVFTSLTHQALIKVTGSEALSFLQGQFSSDLNQVSDTKAQYSAYCDPQGNVLANFLVFKYQGDLYLSFDGSLREAILKRLQMFIMRSDVQLEEVSKSLIQVGFAGEFTDLDMQYSLDTKVKETFECGMISETGMENLLAIKVPGPYHKYALFGPTEEMITVWKNLRNNGDVTNSFDWTLLDIAAGIATVTSATSAQFTAQFFNLDKLEAINFKKGCFPGQEIIARIHYRGKVTKRTLRIHIDEALNLVPGDTLELKDPNDKTHKLTVINSNPGVLEGTLCLAIATLKSLDAVEGELTTLTGSAVQIEPLPYSIKDEE